MNTKDIKPDVLNILVYGRSGTKKTSFAATCPKPYFFDTDKGMMTLRGRDIEYDTYERGDWKKLSRKISEVTDEKSPIETLVFDSITTLQEVALAEGLLIDCKKEPDIHVWGITIRMLRLFLESITKCKKNVVVIAHEQLVQDDITKEVQVLPAIAGKDLPSQMPLYFDEVYHTEMKRNNTTKLDEYKMLTRCKLRNVAKSRLGCLDEYEVPDFNAIMKKVKGVK